MDSIFLTTFVVILCGLINAEIIITTPVPNDNVQGRNLFGQIRPQYPNNNFYPGTNYPGNNNYPGTNYPGTNTWYPGTNNINPGTNFNPGGNTFYPNPNRPNIYFPNYYPNPNRPNIYPSRPNNYPNYQPDYVFPNPNNGFYRPTGNTNTNVNPRPSYYSG